MKKIWKRKRSQKISKINFLFFKQAFEMDNKE
jgi:hypothetical protein